MVSAEPAVRVQRLARLAAADPALRGPADDGHARTQILAALDGQPRPSRTRYHAYLAKFGDRSVEELKLESATLHDDPLPLFRAVGALAQQIARGGRGRPLRPRAVVGRSAARARRAGASRDALARRPLRRLLFHWVLRHARRRVRDRENLRFERTRLFGRVRRIFVELGRRLHALDVLDDPRDVFYLEVDEVLGFVDGRSTCTDLRSLAALRKREFDGYEAGPPPADRFETRGAGVPGPRLPARAGRREPRRATSARVSGCCPGVVRGPVRVVTDPRTRRPGAPARSSSPSTPTPAGSCCFRRRSACSSSAAACCRTRRSSRASWASRRSSRSRASRAGCRTATGSSWTAARGRRSAAVAGRPMRERSARRRSRTSPRIRYAQCWEDADVLLAALDVQPGDVCLSIASAGDNALALLTRQPSRVIALDLSPAQLACLELRVAAYRVLTHPELLELIGSRPSTRRDGAVRAAAGPLLGGATRDVLGRASPRRSNDGIGGAGKFERYFALFRHRVLPLVHRRRDGGGAAAAEERSRQRRHVLRRALGHLALAAAVPRVLLALRHGPARPRSRVLPLRRTGRRRVHPRSARGTRSPSSTRPTIRTCTGS